MLRVEVRSEISRPKINARRLTLAARRILKALGRTDTSLSVLLTGDRQIQKINRRFLRHDRPTDVMAFGGDKKFLGDLVISVETAAAQAKAYGNSFSYELLFYLAHGILHLLGRDDNTAAKRAAMHRAQVRLLKKAGVAAWKLDGK